MQRKQSVIVAELAMRFQFSICLPSTVTTKEEEKSKKNGILIAGKGQFFFK